MMLVRASSAPGIQAVGSSLVSRGKVKQLLAGAWETELTCQFPQLARHVSVMIAV
jgi:hypothetical protein